MNYAETSFQCHNAINDNKLVPLVVASAYYIRRPSLLPLVFQFLDFCYKIMHVTH